MAGFSSDLRALLHRLPCTRSWAGAAYRISSQLPGERARLFGRLVYSECPLTHALLSDALRRRLGSMIRAAAARDSAALVEEMQAAGVIAREIDVGPVRRLVRLMLNEALTPPFSSNVIDKLSGDLYDLVYGQPFRLPVELIFVMRALSTFEGVGRSLDPAFSLVAIAKPYLLPLMTSSGNGSSDLFNEIGRQVGALSSRAAALPRRLDENLERLEQGDLQLQVRLGESDRQFRRMTLAQQSIGQSVLLGCLALATAIAPQNSMLQRTLSKSQRILGAEAPPPPPARTDAQDGEDGWVAVTLTAAIAAVTLMSLGAKLRA